MRIMDKLQLRHKLLLLISLPLTLVLLFAIDRAYERQLGLMESNNIYDFAQATDLVKIVHRLQYERGKSAAYLSSRSATSLIEWRNAGELTDRFISEIPELKKSFESKGSNEAILRAIENIEGSLTRLSLIRSSIINDQKLTAKTARELYTDLIKVIHGNIRDLVKLAPQSQIFQLADSTSVISELKETEGLQRAIVATILSKGSATEDEIEQLDALKVKEKYLAENFLELAPHRIQEMFFAAGFDEIEKYKSSLITEITQSPVGTKIEYDANRWFRDTTIRINALRELEKEITQTLLLHAEDARTRSENTLWVTLITALIIILIVSIVTWFATGKLASGFLQLRESSIGFTENGALKKVSVSTADEVGEVAQAYNHLIDKLIDISQAAESVANGEYDQEIEVKSEQDSLALSLNHMFRTLRESVDSMQKENWIKTGQSELSSKINTDQSLHVLAQNAISYLAPYIKAPVGAIYLVDKEGTAELCASYAYTIRKDNKNRFVKGESLIGQTVLERKPIIVEQIPDDYICVQSGLGKSIPQNVLVYPLLYNDTVLGVLELGTLKTLSKTETNFLKKATSSLAIALHATVSRERTAVLLEQTQSQSEELQNQQAELEQANSELEQHTDRLKEQQDRLEKANSELEQQAQELEESKEELVLQKKQLIKSNEELMQQTSELEKRNKEVETRSEELENARHTLELKAEELTAASKYKTEFLANMSHELRTPLNSLLLLAQTLKENDERNLTEHQLEAIKIIFSSGSDLLNLINDILDLSKVEAGKLKIENQCFDSREIIDQVVKQFLPLANDKNLALNIHIDEHVPKQFFSDAQRIQQILRNLIGNAIKFTEQGSVSLSVALNQDGCFEFAVKDTGIGIPEKLKADIFEAFQQGDGSTRRKYSGTGLGLTISRELSHKLGGEILLNSKEGAGSEFTLVLPASIAIDSTHETDGLTSENATDQSNSNGHGPEGNITRPSNVENDKAELLDDRGHDAIANKTANDRDGSRRNGNVVSIKTNHFDTYIDDDRNSIDPRLDLLLIIEDDKVFAQSIRDLAHKRSMQCIVSKNVKMGVEMAKHFMPNSIVLDMILPDGSGNDVINALKKDDKTKDIPIHVVSSLNKDELKVDQSIDVITKPISKDAIDEALKKILKQLHPDQKQTLLVIEDDPNTRKTIEMLLKNTDLNVIHAATGKEGLKRIKKDEPNCMILDLSLPDMDSVDILKLVASPELPEPMPVVIYTGRDLNHEEYKNLRQYTANIIIKGSLAHERLLNEITLFLHSLKPKNIHSNKKDLVTDNKLEGKKVLVVDDDMRNTFALASLLRRNGMTVILADNGSLALEKLSENKDIELAIMDIMMPVMDGYEAIRKIRERNDYKDLPIIALTAKAMPEDRDKCLKVGANDYLAKPVDSERLLSAIRIWGTA